jgi:hypothetical protein
MIDPSPAPLTESRNNERLLSVSSTSSGTDQDASNKCSIPSDPPSEDLASAFSSLTSVPMLLSSENVC